MTEAIETPAWSPGDKAVAIPDDVKADRIMDALADGAKLTRAELVAVTGMSPTQVATGWGVLRRSLGTMCVIENHRERSTYSLTDDDTDRARAYQLWQARHVYARLRSLRATLAQMSDYADRKGDTAAKAYVYPASLGVAKAQDQIGDLVRTVGITLGHATDEIEQWLAAQTEERAA